MGNKVLANAEKHKRLNRGQQGSRKGMRAAHAALKKTLWWDIVRYKRRPAALCSNDALSCYDRMVHNIVIMSMLSMGANISSLTSMFSALQNMKVKIRTSHGDSIEMYESGQPPDQGVAQGNGCGPQSYASLSSPMMDAMDREGHGAIVITPISRESSRIAMDAYVDDADQSKDVESKDENWTDVAAALNEAVRSWSGYLRASGGALVPGKSFWYMVDFTWKDGKWKYSCLLYTSPSPRDLSTSRMPSSA